MQLLFVNYSVLLACILLELMTTGSASQSLLVCYRPLIPKPSAFSNPRTPPFARMLAAFTRTRHALLEKDTQH